MIASNYLAGNSVEYERVRIKCGNRIKLAERILVKLFLAMFLMMRIMHGSESMLVGLVLQTFPMDYLHKGHSSNSQYEEDHKLTS